MDISVTLYPDQSYPNPQLRKVSMLGNNASIFSSNTTEDNNLNKATKYKKNTKFNIENPTRKNKGTEPDPINPLSLSIGFYI